MSAGGQRPKQWALGPQLQSTLPPRRQSLLLHGGKPLGQPERRPGPQPCRQGPPGQKVLCRGGKEKQTFARKSRTIQCGTKNVNDTRGQSEGRAEPAVEFRHFGLAQRGADGPLTGGLASADPRKCARAPQALSRPPRPGRGLASRVCSDGSVLSLHYLGGELFWVERFFFLSIFPRQFLSLSQAEGIQAKGYLLFTYRSQNALWEICVVFVGPFLPVHRGLNI